jgi:hypothetical protein
VERPSIYPFIDQIKSLSLVSVSHLPVLAYHLCLILLTVSVSISALHLSLPHPILAQCRHSLPPSHHTVPCHTMPALYHTAPCCTMPAPPPCHATPCHTTPHHTMPHHATPCHTTPHHTVPCLPPHHTAPRFLSDTLVIFYAVSKGVLPIVTVYLEL